MSAVTQALLAGTGSSSAVSIASLFSAQAHAGTGGAATLTPNINMAAGGLFISKRRIGTVKDWAWFDTVRGVQQCLRSNSTAVESTEAQGVTAFNGDGVSVGTLDLVNASAGATYFHYYLKKYPGFFDIVGYTGNGTTQAIAHSLGEAPGFVIIKRRDGAVANWPSWHVGLTSGSYILFNDDVAQSSSGAINRFGNNTITVNPTSSDVTIGSDATVNNSGTTYVMYCFGNNANFITCGTYAGNGSSSGPSVSLGWEPGLVFVRDRGGSVDWPVFDYARTMPAGADAFSLFNTNDLEGSTDHIDVSGTGFQLASSDVLVNKSGSTYIYLAIKKP